MAWNSYADISVVYHQTGLVLFLIELPLKQALAVTLARPPLALPSTFGGKTLEVLKKKEYKPF